MKGHTHLVLRVSHALDLLLQCGAGDGRSVAALTVAEVDLSTEIGAVFGVYDPLAEAWRAELLTALLGE